MELKTLELKVITFNGKQRSYSVVDRNITPAPKYFISYNKGNPFISDEVPEEFRESMVFHELTEFELLQDKPDRCLQALKSELETVPKNKKEDYLKFRLEVFESLIDFLKKYDPNSKLIIEVNKSLKYLRE